MVEKRFDKEKKILYVTSIGKIQAAGMMKGVEFLKKAQGLPENLKILEDATEAKVVYSHEELEQVMRSLEKAIDKFKAIWHAVVLNDPTNTAFAILAGLMLTNQNYSLKVFSTRSAAEHWLSMIP